MSDPVDDFIRQTNQRRTGDTPGGEDAPTRRERDPEGRFSPEGDAVERFLRRTNEERQGRGREGK